MTELSKDDAITLEKMKRYNYNHVYYSHEDISSITLKRLELTHSGNLSSIALPKAPTKTRDMSAKQKETYRKAAIGEWSDEALTSLLIVYGRSTTLIRNLAKEDRCVEDEARWADLMEGFRNEQY